MSNKLDVPVISLVKREIKTEKKNVFRTNVLLRLFNSQGYATYCCICFRSWWACHVWNVSVGFYGQHLALEMKDDSHPREAILKHAKVTFH